MIDYIKGEIAELQPATAVLECYGIGYALSISLNTYSAIQGKKECKLYVYEAVRQDAAQVLYGFCTKQERELFLLLISVSGIGGNTARTILSALSPAELVNCISTENTSILKGVKGLGLKTAQRIIVDLKDKIKNDSIAVGGSDFSTVSVPSSNKQVHDEAVSALTMLGFAIAPSQKVVYSILKAQPNATVEQVIKLALKQL
ncbi:MAG: Holliday junction branch migration protein RuvA [Bacteroidaceae bacterium]|nr:Holliday junction branch migration protein RuvA [Bacteroidaceae bacterium]